MIRKILPFLLTVCLVCACTGCTGRDNGVSSTVSGNSSTTRPSPTPEVSALPDASSGNNGDTLGGSGESGSPPDGASSGSSGSAGTTGGTGTSGNAGTAGTGSMNAGSFGPFREALRGVYGESSHPGTQLTEEEIRTELGLTDDLYEEVFAERAGETGRPDMFIAVKAKTGKAEQVKDKLTAYKKQLSGDKNYVNSAAQIEAAQVYAEGDYVFFLLTGGAGGNNGSSGNGGGSGSSSGNGGSSGNNGSSQGMADRLGEEVQRGIDAIKEALGGMM